MVLAQLGLVIQANDPPKFLHDMNNVQISEHTQPGSEEKLLQ